MSETGMWDALRAELRGLHPVRIESRAIGMGTPDVNYAHGWIELKYLRSWPKRPETRVRIEHYTKEQRSWAVQRTQAGGRVFLLLKVGENEWLLLHGAVAARSVGQVNRADLYKLTMARWTRKPKATELRPWLDDSSSPTFPTEKLSKSGAVAKI